MSKRSTTRFCVLIGSVLSVSGCAAVPAAIGHAQSALYGAETVGSQVGGVLNSAHDLASTPQGLEGSINQLRALGR